LPIAYPKRFRPAIHPVKIALSFEGFSLATNKTNKQNGRIISFGVSVSIQGNRIVIGAEGNEAFCFS
jgi:hypothetical protein